MTELQKYLSNKGWEYKKKGVELVVQECPMCKDEKGHFYINDETGQWKCQKCGKSGNLFTLKKTLGDVLDPVRIGKPKKLAKPIKKDIEGMHKTLLGSTNVMKWLKEERKISEDMINDFKLLLDGNRIGFPYFQGGNLVNIKWRSKSKEFTREKGCSSSLFNIDNIQADKAVILAEGEFDVIAATQMGFECVVSGSNGAASFDESWAEELANAPEIFLAYDNDPTGEEGAKKAATLLGRARCKRVYLPFKDFNECLVNVMAREDLMEFFNDAVPYKDEDMLHFNDMTKRVHDDIYEQSQKGLLTGWKEFDEFMGGVRPGEVTVISGDTSAGKTTLCCNIGYRLIENGVVFVSTETAPEKIIRKLYSINSGVAITEKTPHECIKEQEEFYAGKRLYFLDAHGEVSFDKIRDTLEYTRRYGVQVAVLDHLHFFLTGQSMDNDRIEIERFMRSLVKLARATGMHIFLVCHPTKLSESDDGSPRIVRPNDLKGSAAIKQDAHNILSLWRNPNNKDKPAVLYIQKVRDDNGFPGSIDFKFDYRSQRYQEIA